MTISRLILFRMRKFSDTSCVKYDNKHSMFRKFLPKMRPNMVQPDRPHTHTQNFAFHDIIGFANGPQYYANHLSCHIGSINTNVLPTNCIIHNFDFLYVSANNLSQLQGTMHRLMQLFSRKWRIPYVWNEYHSKLTIIKITLKL